MAKKKGENTADLTDKQEAFCRSYMETNSATASYRKVYDCKNMKDNVIHVKAFELLNSGKVAVRLQILKDAAAKRNDITVDRVLKELALIGFSNMMDYISVQNGGAFVDLSKLTREQAAAIGEVTSEVYMEGDGDEAKAVKRTKFKLVDKRAALVDMGKHLGMFVERKEIGAPGEFSKLTDDELNDVIAEHMQDVVADGVEKGKTKH